MTTPLSGSVHTIEVKVGDINQLFNSMDPSPFHERDLDHDAEHFILSWAREGPQHLPLHLIIHCTKPQSSLSDSKEVVTEAFHHYFSDQAEMARRDLKQLIREGRFSLLIGLLFLTICSFLAKVVIATQETGTTVIAEGLTIGGWVAMWHPIDIYLYRWWPILRLKRLYQKLAIATVELREAT